MMSMNAEAVIQLQQAEKELTREVVRKAHLIEDIEFFKAIRPSLDKLCTAVHSLLRADSSAVFFVPEDETHIRMCGASGNLARTLDTFFEAGCDPEHVKGTVYESKLGQLNEWPMTNQIWHLGLARIANSLSAFQQLSGRPLEGKGVGDDYAYNPQQQGWSLKNTFRTFLAVPIFARGRTHPVVQSLPDLSPSHREFLRRYRVIGIIKVEGKKPTEDHPVKSQDELWARLPQNEEGREIQQRLEAWFNSGGTVEALHDLFKEIPAEQDQSNERTERLLADTMRTGSKQPYPPMVDFLTTLFDARFSKDDAELLVTIAMHLGRILALRTMQHAAQQGILLTENTIGELDIRYSDILPLTALQRTTKRVCTKMEFELGKLQRQLEEAKWKQWSSVEVTSLPKYRSPVRGIAVRPKNLDSLFGKLIAKLQETDYGHDARQFSLGEKRHTGLVSHILKEVDDLAGARVVCGYLSDVRAFLDAMSAHFPSRGIDFEKAKIDEFLDKAKPGGYRGVHLIVPVNVVDLISDEDRVLLLRELTGQDRSDETQPLWFPCEIQLRTAYQHSWSEASQELLYKEETPVPEDLREYLRILSELLYEADQIADLVRQGIERVILPDDHGLADFLCRLRDCLRPEDYALVEFGTKCARHIHRDNFLYGGRPHFIHLLGVSRCLVERFGIEAPYMLLLALWRDIWMNERRTTTRTWKQIIEQECGEIREEMGHRITSAVYPPKEPWFTQLMALMSESWESESRDEGQHDYRINRLTSSTRMSRESGTRLSRESMKKGLIVEAAILLSEFGELPFDPNRNRAVTEFDRNYDYLEQILQAMESSSTKRRIVRESERVVRQIAEALRVPRPIEWNV
jgi:ppGpp synthetase/RelA/SpoT-type nucleotidyltranferase